MTWIKIVPSPEADEVLRRAYRKQQDCYPEEYAKPAATVGEESFVASHSLIPPALEYAFGTLAVLLSDELPLARSQHEMIATVVSVRNRCRF